MFFNEETKLKFMRSYATERNYEAVELAFRKAYKYESAWNMDVCLQQDREEVQKMIDSMSGTSIYADNTVVLVLRDYCKWCINEDIKGVSTNLIQVKSPAVKKLQKKSIANPKQLQGQLDAVLDPEEKKTIHNTYRALFWMAFAGIIEEYAYKITDKNVDLYNKLITYGDNAWVIYKEGFRSIEFCTNSKTFTVFRGNYKDEGRVMFRMSEQNNEGGEYILRGLRSMPDKKGKAMILGFSKLQTSAIKEGKTDLVLSYQSVWKSGIFYAAYQNEIKGIDPDFDLGATMSADRGRRRLDTIEANYSPERINHISEELRRDYIRWKLAHNL